ncbi:uncharacterized protein [Triticum aestivum]|uniref:uncharacterized protein n=1 Tax=Triticum aestivum TaxID=4565 RepID=UPI001D01B34C|nr:uncharacterized protein LOC123101283 [Triticum aestivum]
MWLGGPVSPTALSPSSVHGGHGGRHAAARGRRWPCAGHPAHPGDLQDLPSTPRTTLTPPSLLPRAAFIPTARARDVVAAASSFLWLLAASRQDGVSISSVGVLSVLGATRSRPKPPASPPMPVPLAGIYSCLRRFAQLRHPGSPEHVSAPPLDDGSQEPYDATDDYYYPEDAFYYVKTGDD